MEDRNPWTIKSSELKYNNPWISLTEHQVIHPGGKDGIYGIVHFKNIAVGIIPLDEDYNTWIVGQYRLTLNKYSWEIPEGGGALDVDPLISAQRELKEETGIEAASWQEIMRIDMSNSVTDEVGVVYVAKNLKFHPPEPDEDEELKIRKLPFHELFQIAMEGKITDALALTAILKAQFLIEQGLI